MRPTNAQVAEFSGQDSNDDKPGAGARARAGAGEAVQGEGGSSGVVQLDRPKQFDRALALKSEKIVYCPIEKV